MSEIKTDRVILSRGAPREGRRQKGGLYLRENISKRVRFDVFKRDSFKCQYCGKAAPEVVLELDHIKPVAAGGDNNITNLITSCFDCNRGKADKTLTENATLTKQKAQLDELNEKRIQLEMLAEWREELVNLDDAKLEILNRIWSSYVNSELSQEQRLLFKSLLKRYELPLIIDSLETSLTQYLKFDKSGHVMDTSIDKVIDFVEKIAKTKKRMEKNPHLKDLYYARGIVRNRLMGRYADDKRIIILLTKAHSSGASTEDLIELCKVVKNWTSFKAAIDSFVEEGVSIHQGIEEVNSNE